MKIRIIVLAILLVSPIGLYAQQGYGYLDSTFNETGTVPGKKVFTFPSNVGGKTAVVDASGRITIGACYTSTIYFKRLNEDGSEDAFATDSMPHFYTQQITCSAIQPDGKLLFGGARHNGLDLDMMVIRFNRDGSFDNTFSGDGIATFNLSPGPDEVNDIAIQSTGAIVLVGGSNSKIAIIRLSPAGIQDGGFNGGTGAFVTAGTSEKARGVDLFKDTIVVAADFYVGGYNNLTILKLSPGGVAVSGFGSGGRRDFLSPSYEYAVDVIVQPDGNILFGSSNGGFKVMRFLPDATFDVSFGSSGVFTYSPGTLTDMVIEDKKIILSGYYYGGGSDFATVVRTDMNGIIDNTFGQSGRINISPISGNARPMSAAISSDNNLLLIGEDSYNASVYKVKLRSVMHIIGSDYVLPNSAETFKVIVPASWTGYTYEWIYSDPSAYFVTPNTAKTVTLYFTDSTASGTLTCYVKAGGVTYAYEEKVITVNSGPSNASELAALSCQPEVTDCFNGYIDFFSLGSITNQFSGCSDNGYSDFTRSDFADTLAAGGVYSASIVIGSSGSATHVGIWIDYNNDGDFNNTDEFVGEGDNSKDLSTVKVSNIIFKNKEGYDGPKRLRVRSRPVDKFTATEYCSYTSSELEGETEDYLIVLSEQSIMEAPQIITPNEDGKNDYFVIRGIDPDENNKNKLTVFDRMGNVQYSSTNYENNWNGVSSDGDKLTPGTYYYVFTKDEDDFIRGFVEIRY